MNLAKAFAYIRFSSSKQREGDSLRRQIESSRNYCVRNSLILDEREFKDFGKSAYKKANIKKGSALSAFLALVESGDIPSGSFLLIESIDRLSRADIYTALMLFGSIINKGIKIVEISKNQIYTEETLTQLGPMLSIMADTLRAHDESRIKGVRSSANWEKRQQNARDFATPITRECPRWLRVSQDGKNYEVIEENVRSIEFVMQLRKSGLGASTIATKCNQLQLPVPGKGKIWHLSLINRLFRNVALIGHYQPYKVNKDGQRVPFGDPIKSYYPSVISQDLFDSVQQINLKSKAFPKRRDRKYRNFLQGLLYCSCGASVHRKLKSNYDLDYSRYYCSKRMLGVTKCSSIDCRRIEDTVVWFMSENAPGLVNFDTFSDETTKVEAVARAKVEEYKLQIERLLNLTQHGKENEIPEVIIQRINELEYKKKLQEKIAERMAKELSDSAVYWGIKADQDFVRAIRDGESEKLALLRFQISRLVDSFDLSEDRTMLNITLKNTKSVEISITRNYFDF
jgi:DNA invertase Pin-like site-specific DNA recombinase